MLRGPTPIQLSQLDISPAIQAGALEQQAITQMASGLQSAIMEFSQKQQEKKVKRERDTQIDAFLPGLLESTGLEIEAGTPEYNAFAKYLKQTSGDDILSGIKQIQEFAPQEETVTPSLQTITGPGGESVYTYGGEVISPKNVFDPNAPATAAQGFEPEFPMSYMIPYNDMGTPDPSDDTPATRVQVTTVSKDPGGLLYEDGTPVTGGAQVYRDPVTGGLRRLDETTMFPMSDTGVRNIEEGLTELKNVHEQTLQDLPKLQQYVETRGKMSDSGAQRLLNNFGAAFNAFLGEDLTFEQRAQATGKAQFRQLLGTLRLDVLGPGVLTEFDRKVLEEAIGGFGPFTTNEMAREIVQGVIDKRISKGRAAAEEYNRQLNKSAGGTQYYFDPIDLSVYDFEEKFDASRDYSNDYKTAEEAAAFAKEKGAPGFIFNKEFYKLD